MQAQHWSQRVVKVKAVGCIVRVYHKQKEKTNRIHSRNIQRGRVALSTKSEQTRARIVISINPQTLVSFSLSLSLSFHLFSSLPLSRRSFLGLRLPQSNYVYMIDYIDMFSTTKAFISFMVFEKAGFSLK